MSAELITGMSGAGKSTIAAALARRGLAAIDSDNDPWLARSVDTDGNVVEDSPVPDFDWLARHSWAWDPARLDELIRAARPATLDAILSRTLASSATSQASKPGNQPGQ